MAHRTFRDPSVSGYGTDWMFRLAFLIVFFGLAACGQPTRSMSPLLSERPMRIVSLDFCADQYVLKLADREQILAISPDGVKHFSHMRETAIGVPVVRSIAEDVLVLKPDLVVRSYGGGPNASAFFERAGIPVLQVGWASSIHGEEVGAIPFLIKQMADGLGQPERGKALVEDYVERLDRLKTNSSGRSALYVTPSGVTSGEGSLIHDAMLAAGLENYMQKSGWHSLPLEALAYSRPNLVATSYFGERSNHQSNWSAARHPMAQRELAATNQVALEGAWTSCGGWFILNAVEALSTGAAQ